jgi:[ribosomal protein S18]-alanine N-acetyltransferase
MDEPVSIAEGGIADLEAVMRVMEDSFDPAYGEAWTSAQCAGLMPMPGVWLSLARDGDDVVGFALARIVLKEAELLLLAVRHEGRRRGIGQMLLDRFTLVATGRGADRLHLEVRDGNPAMKLYARSGFAEVGRRKNYYTGRDGQIYDALTLTRAATFQQI